MHDSSTIVFSICPHYCSTPVLRAYTAIPGADIVRCLRETFDCLFAILDSQQDSIEINQATFTALLYV